MRRRRTFLIVFVILVVILLIGVGALAIVSRGRGGILPQPTPLPEEAAIPEEEPILEEPTEKVVVAVQDVPPGMEIPPDAVQIRAWPVKELPDDPIYDLDEVVGMIAFTKLIRGQPVRRSQIKRVILEPADIALAIPQGKVAFALPVTTLGAVANAIRAGSHIDVLVSFSIVDVDQDAQVILPLILTGGEDCLAGCQPVGDQIPRLVSQYTVQNALVLGVGIWDEEMPGVQVLGPGEEPGEELEVPLVEGEEEEAPPPEAPTVATSLGQVTVTTLAISPQDALVLKWALESNSSIHMVMRSARDGEVVFAQPEAVTLKYMIDRFQISLPPKLPHVPENQFEYTLLEVAGPSPTGE